MRSMRFLMDNYSLRGVHRRLEASWRRYLGVVGGSVVWSQNINPLEKRLSLFFLSPFSLLPLFLLSRWVILRIFESEDNAFTEVNPAPLVISRTPLPLPRPPPELKILESTFIFQFPQSPFAVNNFFQKTHFTFSFLHVQRPHNLSSGCFVSQDFHYSTVWYNLIRLKSSPSHTHRLSLKTVYINCIVHLYKFSPPTTPCRIIPIKLHLQSIWRNSSPIS